MNVSGRIAGVQQDTVAPHSATAAHSTAPALSSGAACVIPAAAYVSQAAARVSPLDARRASLALSQPRVAVPESETAEHENQDGQRSEIYFPGHNARVRQDAVTLHSTAAAQTAPALATRSTWSLGLLDSDTVELRRQLARLPRKIFYLDYRGLRMDRISEVALVQVCWTLWRPTPPLQHLTGPLQLWPRALFVPAPCVPRLLRVLPLSLVLL